MKRPILLLCLLLMLCGCAPRTPAEPTQIVLQALQEQNIAYEPVDLWQTEAIPAYEYRDGVLHPSQVQHSLVFTAGNCLGVLRETGSDAAFYPLHGRPARLMSNSFGNGAKVAFFFTAEGCSLLWGESLVYAFDAPDEALEAIGKKALLGLARQQEGHAVRFARHLRASTLPEVPTLPAETPEDIPELVRTAAPYGACRLSELSTESDSFWITCEIPHYVYSGGALSLYEGSGPEARFLFCGESLVGQVIWNDNLLQEVENGRPYPLSLFSSESGPDHSNLAAKVERFFRSGDSIAIVSTTDGPGLLVVNGTVIPISETEAYPAAVEKVQAAVDAQGLTHAKVEPAFSFRAVTETQYYDKPWPRELNRGPEEPAP